MLKTNSFTHCWTIKRRSQGITIRSFSLASSLKEKVLKKIDDLTKLRERIGFKSFSKYLYFP